MEMSDKELLELAAKVFPVPHDEEEMRNSGLKASPTMPGHINPCHDGMYLRYFEDYDDWAFSEWTGDKWTMDGFFNSDIQDAPWRGGISAD